MHKHAKCFVHYLTHNKYYEVLVIPSSNCLTMLVFVCTLNIHPTPRSTGRAAVFKVNVIFLGRLFFLVSFNYHSLPTPS